MPPVPHPVEIEYASEQGVLKILFSDDLRVVHPVSFLRGFCPCARCQGHGGGPPRWNPLRTPAASVIDDVTPVGTYAVCIVWGDGHDTGIHSYENLRTQRAPEGFEPEAIADGTTLDEVLGA